MINYLKLLWGYVVKYVVSVGIIWGAMQIITYFKVDLLKNYMGSLWYLIYLMPIPFLSVAAFIEVAIKCPVEGWVAKINNIIGDAKLYGEIKVEPTVEIVGQFKLTEDQEVEASNVRAGLKINDAHAMIYEEPSLALAPIKFNVETLDYAALTVLRRQNLHGYILSANSVIICSERRLLIVHHRAKKSATYEGKLHTVGGSYQPIGVFPNKEGDRYSLIRTAHREADEEIQASILTEDIPPMILGLEPSTKFIQLVFLGANISEKQCDKLISNWEGEGVVKIPFDELESRLTKPIFIIDSNGKEQEIKWVPTGKAAILAWLAFGAPNAGIRASFGGYSPKELFNKIVGK